MLSDGNAYRVTKLSDFNEESLMTHIAFEDEASRKALERYVNNADLGLRHPPGKLHSIELAISENPVPRGEPREHAYRWMLEIYPQTGDQVLNGPDDRANGYFEYGEQTDETLTIFHAIPSPFGPQVAYRTPNHKYRVRLNHRSRLARKLDELNAEREYSAALEKDLAQLQSWVDGRKRDGCPDR